MADSVRTQAQRRRADDRERRRSLAEQPFDQLDEAAKQRMDGAGSDSLAAAKRAAATAAAAALAGALGGAAKAVLDRHGRAKGGATAERKIDWKPDRSGSTGRGADEQQGEQVQAEAADDIEDEATQRDDVDASTEDGGFDQERGEDREFDQGRDQDRPDDEVPSPEPPVGASSSDVKKVVDRARRHVEDLLGSEAESVSAVERSNGSWSVTVEVVEMHRVPESTDVLSSYEVVLDDDGNLVRLGRPRRYRRSQVEDRA